MIGNSGDRLAQAKSRASTWWRKNSGGLNTGVAQDMMTKIVLKLRSTVIAQKPGAGLSLTDLASGIRRNLPGVSKSGLVEELVKWMNDSDIILRDCIRLMFETLFGDIQYFCRKEVLDALDDSRTGCNLSDSTSNELFSLKDSR